MSRNARLLAPLVLLALGGSLSHAAVEPRSAQFEVVGGYYAPGPGFLEDDLFFGLRAGFNAGARLYFDLQLAFQGSSSESETIRLDYDAFLLDLTAGWTFLPRKRANPMLYGGIGWVNVTADIESGTPDVPGVRGLAEDSPTLHLGGGVRISVTKGSYLRLDYRGRWFDEREEDELDGEATVAYGWYF